MKKLLVFLVVIAILFLGLIVSQNLIAKIAIGKGVRAATGLELDMRKVDLSLLEALIATEDLRLYNPPAFQDRILANVPVVFIHLVLRDYFRGKLHFEKIILHLDEFQVIKNEKGELNLDSLKPLHEDKKKKKPAPDEKKKKFELEIDTLELKIGTVIYKDYTKKGKPLLKTYDIKIDETYENIDDLDLLIRLVVMRALIHTTISDLTSFGFDYKFLEGTLIHPIGRTEQVAKETLHLGEKALHL